MSPLLTLAGDRQTLCRVPLLPAATQGNVAS